METKEEKQEVKIPENAIMFPQPRKLTAEQEAYFRRHITPADWKLYQDNLFGAIDVNRLDGEKGNPDKWYRRNFELFIEQCRKYYGFGVMKAMVDGGFTDVPVHCRPGYANIVTNAERYYVLNFGKKGEQLFWAMHPVDVQEEKIRVCGNDGNFRYWEHKPLYCVPAPMKDILMYGKTPVPAYVREELIETGRYHCSLDPKTMEPFKEHTDAKGQNYTFDIDGNLLCNGVKVCGAKEAINVGLCKWDPNVVIGINIEVIGEMLRKMPVYVRNGETHIFSESEQIALKHSDCVNVRLNGETVTVGYDIAKQQIIESMSKDKLDQKKSIEKMNELRKKRSRNYEVLV